MRLPLPTNLESRDGDLTQDAKIKNGYIDTEENAPNVVKRAGLELVTTTGDGSIPNDIFVFEDVAYVWRESDPPGAPTLSPVVPPVNEFADFEFDVDVPSATEGGLPNIASGLELSLSADIRCSYGVSSQFNSGESLVVTRNLALASYDGSTVYESAQDTATPGDYSHHIEIKLEAGFFNAYEDSALILSVPNSVQIFLSPTLDSIEFQSGTITNLQFIP